MYVKPHYPRDDDVNLFPQAQVYDQSYETALLELGFDARGVAVSENWQVATTLLRTWLRRLRGLCTYPQVGTLQGTADKPSALKTIGEVLEASA